MGPLTVRSCLCQRARREGLSGAASAMWRGRARRISDNEGGEELERRRRRERMVAGGLVGVVWVGGGDLPVWVEGGMRSFGWREGGGGLPRWVLRGL